MEVRVTTVANASTRSDVGGSWIEDTSPIFPLPTQILPDPDTLLPCPPISPQCKDIFYAWITRFPRQLNYLDVMRGLSRFSSHLKVEARRTNRKYTVTENLLRVTCITYYTNASVFLGTIMMLTRMIVPFRKPVVWLVPCSKPRSGDCSVSMGSSPEFRLKSCGIILRLVRDIGEILNYLGFGVWQWVGLRIRDL